MSTTIESPLLDDLDAMRGALIACRATLKNAGALTSSLDEAITAAQVGWRNVTAALSASPAEDAGPRRCPPHWIGDLGNCKDCGAPAGGPLLLDAMEAVIRDCLSVCAARGWSLHWTARGAYLHLESSELIEAWRGKGESTVAEEAGDVLLVLFSILGAAKVPWADALRCAVAKLDDLRTRPRYAGEEYSATPEHPERAPVPAVDKAPQALTSRSLPDALTEATP